MKFVAALLFAATRTGGVDAVSLRAATPVVAVANTTVASVAEKTASRNGTVSAALIANASSTVSAVGVNASTVVAVKTEKEDSNSSKVDAAMDLIKALSHSSAASDDGSESDEDSSASPDEEQQEAAAPVAPKKPAEHAKLDFGFVAFEANLTAAVNTSIRGVTAGAFWNGGLQSKLIDNFTTSMNAEMKSALTPLKQSISKTWMALKTDDQRDVFVNQLKSSFQPIFSDNLDSILTHLKLGLRRVEKYGADDSKLSKADALEKSEASLYESILAQHCYDSNSKKAGEEKKKFCIASAVSKVAERLTDTEGLIGMSMRFEAGAMGLVQTGKATTAK
jgi:hypothetical protein